MEFFSQAVQFTIFSKFLVLDMRYRPDCLELRRKQAPILKLAGGSWMNFFFAAIAVTEDRASLVHGHTMLTMAVFVEGRIQT